MRVMVRMLMRVRLLTTLLLLPFLCALSLAQVRNVVTMPIEVMGDDNTVRQIRVVVPAGQAASVVGLLGRFHNLSYADKASVQINNAAWVSLRNTTCDVKEPGKSYGGIGGGWSTIKLQVAIPASTVVDGVNYVRFRFNGTDGKSSGFRVIDFNFVTSDGTKVIPANNFAYADPALQKPYYTDAVNISAGERLWRTAALRHSPLVHTNLRVTCGDCHAHDGRDLKYFGYTLFSIVKRCMFHGMDEDQGRQVASYVWSNSTKVYGRPWWPVYQPGPGLDSKPLEAWSAGAGIDAVLETDDDLLPYVTGGGPISLDATLNKRETPIDFQLLDWNHWLPTTHPFDAFGDADPLHDFTNSQMYWRYSGKGTGSLNYGKAMLPALQGPDSKKYITTRLALDLADWCYNLRYNYIGGLTQNVTFTPEYSQKVYSVGLWMSVKLWELIHEFGLQAYGPTIVGVNAETRTGFAGLFETVDPRRMQVPISNLGIGGSTMLTQYHNNAWDEVQIIWFAPKDPKFGKPPDWGYLFGNFNSLPSLTGRPEYARFALAMIKGMQVRNNAYGTQLGKGWQPAHNAPISFLVRPQWADVPNSTKKAVIEKLLAAWIAETASHTPQEYYDSGQATSTETPSDDLNSSRLIGQVWAFIPEFRAVGVSESMLTTVKTWAATVWPSSDWANR